MPNIYTRVQQRLQPIAHALANAPKDLLDENQRAELQIALCKYKVSENEFGVNNQYMADIRQIKTLFAQVDPKSPSDTASLLLTNACLDGCESDIISEIRIIARTIGAWATHPVNNDKMATEVIGYTDRLCVQFAQPNWSRPVVISEAEGIIRSLSLLNGNITNDTLPYKYDDVKRLANQIRLLIRAIAY